MVVMIVMLVVNDSDGGGNDSDGGGNDSDGASNDSDGAGNDKDSWAQTRILGNVPPTLP